jgi:hypothetical protein
MGVFLHTVGVFGESVCDNNTGDTTTYNNIIIAREQFSIQVGGWNPKGRRERTEKAQSANEEIILCKDTHFVKNDEMRK